MHRAGPCSAMQYSPLSMDPTMSKARGSACCALALLSMPERRREGGRRERERVKERELEGKYEREGKYEIIK